MHRVIKKKVEGRRCGKRKRDCAGKKRGGRRRWYKGRLGMKTRDGGRSKERKKMMQE